jgi:hypothetical protein
LRTVGLEPEVFDLFPPFLNRSDMVKFAKLRPDIETCNGMLPMARLLVDETHARDHTPPTTAAAEPDGVAAGVAESDEGVS